MLHHNLDSVPTAQTSPQLFGQIYRAVLAAGAAEGNHQTLEAAALILTHAGIHQRKDAGQKLVHAFLLIQIIDHRRVLARERAEALFAARIGKAATIENKSAAMPSLILGPAAVKRKAEN